MAFGFIKKIFSFGKKEVVEFEQAVETPLEIAAPVPELEAPEPHVHEQHPVQTASLEPIKIEPLEDIIEEMAAPESVVAELLPDVVETEIVVPFDDQKSHKPDSFLSPIALPLEDEGVDGDATTTVKTVLDNGFEVVSVDILADEVIPESIDFAESDLKLEEPAGKILIGATEENTYVPAPEPEEKLSWIGRLKRGLSRSSTQLSSSITGIFLKRKLDEDTLQELEDVLIQADLGMETAVRITDTLSSGRFGKQISDEEVRAIMSSEIEKVLLPVAKPLELDLSHKPHVILVVGVNGTGKTTTIGKLSAKLRTAKLNVWLAAGDTFRAAAIEQLHIWGERTGSPVVSTKIGADAAGLAYDAYEKAKIGGADVLIIDTAGRLQNRTELMDELAKIVRVLNKLDPEAPHTVLQTLDATTGQNALSQVEIFKNVAGVNGLVMTKLDGTARGGILVAIAARHKLPVYFIGVGETVDDLEPFSAKEFASAIAGTE